MVIPPRFYSSISIDQPDFLDFHTANVSPAQAIAILEKNLNRTVNSVNLQTASVLGDPVFVIYLDDGSSYMVNVVSGELIRKSSELAENITRSGIKTEAPVKEIQYLESHDLLYPFGKLPVYRVAFENDSSMYYVSVMDGSLSQSTQITRIVTAITSFHTFEPIKQFTQRDTTRKGLLILTSIVGIAAALTGYYIALLPSIKRRTQSG